MLHVSAMTRFHAPAEGTGFGSRLDLGLGFLVGLWFKPKRLSQFQFRFWPNGLDQRVTGQVDPVGSQVKEKAGVWSFGRETSPAPI